MITVQHEISIISDRMQSLLFELFLRMCFMSSSVISLFNGIAISMFLHIRN